MVDSWKISYWNLPPLLSEAVEASWCYFLENWWMKLKYPLLLKPLATIVQENSQSFYPSEPFRISHFTMRHPVHTYIFQKSKQKLSLCCISRYANMNNCSKTFKKTYLKTMNEIILHMVALTFFFANGNNSTILRLGHLWEK